MAEVEQINVEVAYALPEEQVILPVQVKAGTTVRTAIEQSGLLSRFPQIDIDHADVGIFGKVQTMDTVLKPKDRIEVYRPITCDPKEVRRQRAKKK